MDAAASPRWVNSPTPLPFQGGEGSSVARNPGDASDDTARFDAAVPEPGPGEVLVKVLAASVQSLVLGYDLVGEVVKVGQDVTSPSVGQRVADLTMTGSYA